MRSAELTRQLLAFSRKQIVTPQVVRLNDLVADHYEMLSRLIGEEIQIELIPAKALWNVRIDPNQIHQILTNLAVNARDAITGVGTIRIETANVSKNDSQTDPNLPAGEFVALTFQDTGMGMDSTILGHIFEPFFTTKAEGEGTGLGLATVYGIAKQNDGEVLVSSEPGRGTTIRLYLPRYSGADQSPAVAQTHQAGHTPSGGETILIVEDEPQLLELATVILEKHGYRILGTHHPTEAIACCRNFNDEIHLLLTDVVMPEMNGKQLQSRIKAIRPKIKTLFVSGHTADIISARGVLEHGVDFIQKPYSIKDLTRKVRKALDR
ncbi:MAG: response regulator [Desulfobacteraceae bacterium]